MEKYNGNQKGFIYVSCDYVHQKEVFEKYLEPLAKDGISFWWADDFDSKEEKNLAKSAAVVTLLENLEALSLRCNPLKSIKGIEKLSNLRSLDISYTDVSGEIMDIIKDDPEVNHLELRYVASDDKDKNLLVLEDGEVKE